MVSVNDRTKTGPRRISEKIGYITKIENVLAVKHARYSNRCCLACQYFNVYVYGILCGSNENEWMKIDNLIEFFWNFFSS